MCVYVCVCVCVCVCLCVCLCVYVCVCVLGGEGSLVFVSTALVASSMAMYLTGYGDCLSAFREQLSPPYRCRTGLKNYSAITIYTVPSLKRAICQV